MSVLLLYINYHTNFAILSLYTEVLVSDTQVIDVIFTKKSQTPSSEEELLNIPSPETAVYTLDASVRSHEIELLFDNYDVIGQLRSETGIIQTLTVKRIILPQSWKSADLISRWHRLCWEQQKAAYSEQEYWKDFPRITRETPTPGWPVNTFDFPIDPPNLQGSLTSPTIAYVDPHQRNINVDCDNVSVEDVEIVVRQIPHPSQNSRAGTNWLHWRNMDQGEQSIPWNAIGNFEMDTHALIDGKQVPLIPNRPFVPSNKDIYLTQTNEGTPITSAYWVDDNLWLYIYDSAPSSLVNTIRVMVEDIDVILPIENKKELNLLVGQVKSSNTVGVQIEYRHQTRNDGSVYLGEHYLRTRRPMVHGENSTFLKIESVIDIPTENYFEITVVNPPDESWEQRLWLVEERRRFFLIDTAPSAAWREGVLKKKLISRLHVTKRLEGREIYLGSFIMNPLYNESSQIVGMFEETVFTDPVTIEDGFKFRFYPYGGTLAIDNPKPSDGRSETYEFRVSEWTLGVEHGLQTDQNLAWMVTGTENTPRYRYDSWDEEHPVKRWLIQSPIDPKSDSVSRLSNLAKSSHAVLIDSSMKSGVLQDPNTVLNPRIVGNPQWHSYYDLLKRTQYVGFWHAYDFTFNLGNISSGARNLRIFANYWFDKVAQEQIYASAGDVNVQSLSPSMVVKQSIGGLTASGQPLLSIEISRFKHVFGNHRVVDFVSSQFLYNIVLNAQIQDSTSATSGSDVVQIDNGENTVSFSPGSILENLASLAAMSITSDQQISSTMYVQYTAVYTNADGEEKTYPLSNLIEPTKGLIPCNWETLQAEPDPGFSNSGQDDQSEGARTGSSQAISGHAVVNLNAVHVSQLPMG